MYDRHFENRVAPGEWPPSISIPAIFFDRWVDTFYFTPQLSYLSKYKSLATQIQVSNALRSLRRQISIESQSKPYGYLSHEARLQILPDKYCYILTHSYSIKSRVCLPIRCLNGCAKSKWKIIEDMQIHRPRLVVYLVYYACTYCSNITSCTNSDLHGNLAHTG